MTTVQKIINHSIAGPFYRQHAGAFLFLFFILFGIQPSINDALKTHYAIIIGILTSRNFFFLALGCWTLYTTRVLIFFRGCLQKESYDFLYELNALEPLKRSGSLVQLNLLLLAPILIYRSIIVVVAVNDNLVLNAIPVIITILLLVLAVTAISYRLLGMAKALQQVTNWMVFPGLRPTLIGFILRFVFRRQFFTVSLVKILSFGCLYFFARTEASVFEERMLWLLYITSLAGHSVIVYKNFHFIEAELSFYKNLPVRRITVLLSLLAVYTVLLLPEMWALRAIVINHGNTGEYLWMILTGSSLLLLLHALLYTEDMNMEEYLKLLFSVWVVFVFFSLSRHHWILPAIAFLFSTIIFVMSYYKYEKNTDIEGLD